MKKLLFILSIVFCNTVSAQIGVSPGILFSGQRTPFAPPAGCKLWVKADQITGLSDGDPVSTWEDQSGTSNDLTQSGSARPTYKTNILHGRPVVRWDGVDDYLEKTSATGLDGGAGITIIMVFKTPSAANQTFLSKSDYNTSDSWIWQSLNANNMKSFVFDNCTTDAGNNSEDSDGSEYSMDTYYVVTMVYNGGQSNTDRIKFYVNGSVLSSATTGTIATSLTSCSSSLKVGRIGGAIIPRFYTGDFAEIFIFDSALGTSNRQSVENYLRSKYSL